MKNSLRIVLSAAMLVGSFMRAQLPSDPGASNWAMVSGRVLDSDGRSVAGARISAFPLDVAVSGGMPRQPITDQDGNYRLVLPAYPGKTRLCAIKENAGYPDTQGLLFASSQDVMPEVSLTPGRRMEHVDIHLGPPDGVVQGSIVDAVTGVPVAKSRITLHRTSPEAVYWTSLGSDGHFVYALPNAPIEVSVTAPGYLPWKYKDRLTGVNKLVINSGDHRNIVIELTPKVKIEPSASDWLGSGWPHLTKVRREL